VESESGESMEPMEEVPLKELCESELAMIRARAKKIKLVECRQFQNIDCKRTDGHDRSHQPVARLK